MITRWATFVWLLLIWVALTGSQSVAGVLIGAALAAALLTLFRPTQVKTSGITFRPWQAVRFMAYFSFKLVQANVQVALAVARPERIREKRAVVAVPFIDVSDIATTLLANAVSLTPGTFIIEMRRDPSTMYVHFLKLDGVTDGTLAILEIQRRLVLAIAPAAEVARVDELIARVAAERDTERRRLPWRPLP